MQTQPIQTGSRPDLTENEKESLFVLVYLYMGLGDTANAELILENLKKIYPEEKRTFKYLAAIELERGNGPRTLEYLKPLLQEAVLPTRDAALLLMQAKALWLEGRTQESQNAVTEYLSITGGR